MDNSWFSKQQSTSAELSSTSIGYGCHQSSSTRFSIQFISLQYTAEHLAPTSLAGGQSRDDKNDDEPAEKRSRHASRESSNSNTNEEVRRIVERGWGQQLNQSEEVIVVEQDQIIEYPAKHRLVQMQPRQQTYKVVQSPHR